MPRTFSIRSLDGLFTTCSFSIMLVSTDCLDGIEPEKMVGALTAGGLVPDVQVQWTFVDSTVLAVGCEWIQLAGSFELLVAASYFLCNLKFLSETVAFLISYC